MAKDANKIVSANPMENLIYQIRGYRVLLDSDLAALYGVPTKALNQAVRRNLERFPEDFMFQLTPEEAERLLRSQIVTLNSGINEIDSKGKKDNRSQIVTGSQKHRDPRFRPFAFTEQGVAMLSSVLRSPRAVQVNIEIMRTFVRLRQWLASNAELSKRLNDLEQKYDDQFRAVFEAIRELMDDSEIELPSRGREIGFHAAREPRRDGRTKALAKSR
ncbi:MAG TPA: ORF6N domain-containing protein [Verrucomicrobiae bacterium]|jgi:hypothetical protein|nr:ORF6N domain-containing protein [Verrucomicrobiae bacterium]